MLFLFFLSLFALWRYLVFTSANESITDLLKRYEEERKRKDVCSLTLYQAFFLREVDNDDERGIFSSGLERILIDDLRWFSSQALLLRDESRRSSLLRDFTGSLLFRRWSMRCCLLGRDEFDEEFNDSTESSCSEWFDGDGIFTVRRLDDVSSSDRFSITDWGSEWSSLNDS